MIFLRIIGRLIVISLAFFAAALAAAVVAAVGFQHLYGVPPAGAGDPVGDVFDLFFLLFVTGLAISHFSLAPAGVAIIVAEVFRLRSWLFYAAAGALSGLTAMLALEHEAAADARFSHPEAALFLACGLVAGLVYWLVAGRGAGSFMPAPDSRSAG